MENSHYLGREKVGKLLRQFSIPCICSLIISCLYNIVDQIFVGNMIGYVANGATGIIFPITVIGWGISLFFGDGAAAALSIAFGKNDMKSIHQSVGNGMLWTFLSGILIVAISYISGDNLLWMIGATNENIQMAHEYGFIIYSMMPLAMLQNALAAIIRADGSPRYSMLAMIVGAAINMIGDPICISVWGIQGAAIATIFGQFASFIICAAYLCKSKTFQLSLSSFWPDWKLTRKMMSLGTASLLTQLFIVITTIINNILLVQYGAQSIYGADIPLSAFVVIMKLFQIVLNIAIGIAVGAQPIVGYNYGAKQYQRVKKLLKLVLKWTGIVCIICTVLFEANSQSIHSYVRSGERVVFGICSKLPATLPLADSIYLSAKGMCDFPSINWPRKGSCPLIRTSRYTANRIFSDCTSDSRHCRCLLGGSACRYIGKCCNDNCDDKTAS